MFQFQVGKHTILPNCCLSFSLPKSLSVIEVEIFIIFIIVFCKNVDTGKQRNLDSSVIKELIL